MNKGVHPSPDGRKWWQVEFWPEGKKKDPSTGKMLTSRETVPFYGTKTEAQLYDLEKRRKPNAPQVIQKMTILKDLLPYFLDDYKNEAAEGTIKDFIYATNKFLPHFGHLKLAQINNTIVQAYKNHRLATTYLPGRVTQPPEKDTPEESQRRRFISKRSVNKELSYLSRIVRWAEEQEPPLIEPGSVKIKLYAKKQTKRTEPIITHTFEEVDTFIQAIGDTRRYEGITCNVALHQTMARDRHGLVLLMYNAGLRNKEARLLEAERVNLPPAPVIDGEDIYYGLITVIRKGGRVQTMPVLTEKLYQELKERLKQTKRGYLYLNPRTGKPYKSIRGGLKKAGERAGVNKKNNPHLFRHDFVTHLYQTGADMKAIQELAGHSSINTTMEIYNDLQALTLRKKAGGFADKLISVRTAAELKENKTKQ